MKKAFQISALALLPVSTNLCASHLTTGIVDKEAYTLMDSYVANTPSAITGFDEIGTGTGIAKTSITIDSLSMFETMVASGELLEYIELVGGVDNASISFNDNGSVTMTVSQAR